MKKTTPRAGEEAGSNSRTGKNGGNGKREGSGRFFYNLPRPCARVRPRTRLGQNANPRSRVVTSSRQTRPERAASSTRNPPAQAGPPRFAVPPRLGGREAGKKRLHWMRHRCPPAWAGGNNIFVSYRYGLDLGMANSRLQAGHKAAELAEVRAEGGRLASSLAKAVQAALVG